MHNNKYFLRFFFAWCLRSESNRQPMVFQTIALTGYELPRHIGKHVRFRQFYDPLFMTQEFVLLYTIAIDARWTVGSGLPSKQRAHIRLIIDFLNEIGRYFSLTSILFREFLYTLHFLFFLHLIL